MTIAEAMRRAKTSLQAAEIDQAAREASALLELATGHDRAYQFAHPEHLLSHFEKQEFNEFVSRRARREPQQYIAGFEDFLGFRFNLTADVLIPRPETEMLVTFAVEQLAQLASPRFAEIGTGSGCIAVSVLANVKAATGYATDISDRALDVARNNARLHGVLERLVIKSSDLFAGFAAEEFDLIVSNPPYIPVSAMKELQPEVRDFEPAVALTDFGGGTTIIRNIIQAAPQFLRVGGWLVLEIGLGQDREVAEMFDRRLWTLPTVWPDFRAVPRMVTAQLAVAD